MVYTGILPIAQNEAGLATVLGHEIAHATSRHGAQRVFQQNAIQIAMMGIQGSMFDMDLQAQRQLLGMLGAGALKSGIFGRWRRRLQRRFPHAADP